MNKHTSNVTEEMLRVFVETFHQTLVEVSSKFFSGEQSKHLLHNSLLPARIIGYVSTQFGAGLEYVTAPTTSIEIIRGSERVEDLLVKAPKALRNVGPVFNNLGRRCSLQGVTLSGAFPFRLGPGGDVTITQVTCKVESLRWDRAIQYAELFSDRTVTRWSTESAQNRAKDEVLAALSILRQSESRAVPLDEYVASYQEKTVLVLGAYDTDGKTRLSGIADELRTLGYEPILITDVPDFEHADLRHKVTLIGSLCRFVIVDDTSPSGHISEIQLCETNRWITIILRSGGRRSTFMTAGLSLTSSVILEREFDPAQPLPVLTEVIKWAEEKRASLRQERNRIFPWRLERP